MREEGAKLEDLARNQSQASASVERSYFSQVLIVSQLDDEDGGVAGRSQPGKQGTSHVNANWWARTLTEGTVDTNVINQATSKVVTVVYPALAIQVGEFTAWEGRSLWGEIEGGIFSRGNGGLPISGYSVGRAN